MTRKLTTCEGPRQRTGTLWVERLKGNDRQRFTVYSSALYGFLTHYTGSKTVPCWEDHDCEGGHNEETLRENFVLHCWSQKKHKEVFVYLTPTAAEILLAQVPKGQTLRGKIIWVQRSESDNGRLTVDVDENAVAPAHIPPAKDAYLSIMRFLCVDLGQVEGPQRSLGTIPLDQAEVA